MSRQLVHAVLPLFLLCGLMSGCAAILRPSEPNRLTIHSEPDSAQVYINGIYRTVTPATVSLPPENRYLLEIHRQGYHTGYDTIVSSIEKKWLIADILSSIPLFAIPIVVDGLGGHWYTIDENDSSRVFQLVPGADDHPTLPTNQPVDSTDHNLALLVELGVAFPSYQVPVLPQSYGLGIGYTLIPSVQCIARVEFNGIGITQQTRDTRGNLYTKDISVLLFSGIVGFRLSLFSTGIYATGGGGVLRPFIPESPASATSLLSLFTAGIGYVFPGDTFLLELRRTVVPVGIIVPENQSSTFLHHTSFRVGFMQVL